MPKAQKGVVFQFWPSSSRAQISAFSLVRVLRLVAVQALLLRMSSVVSCAQDSGFLVGPGALCLSDASLAHPAFSSAV